MANYFVLKDDRLHVKIERIDDGDNYMTEEGAALVALNSLGYSLEEFEDDLYEENNE